MPRKISAISSQDIASRILQKLAPMIMKYAQENGFGLIIDTSKPWPQSPFCDGWRGVDITKAVVEALQHQSGVPAPPQPLVELRETAAPKAPGAGAATKPTTPSRTEPPKQF